MRRRGPGIGGLQRKQEVETRFESLGHDLGQASLAAIENQLEMFQRNLQDFAIKHKDKINRNPVFRAQFQKMCNTIGVDPLASTKSVWTQSLGMGDFYYELAVQLIEICIMTRSQNGGLIPLDDLVAKLRVRRRAIASRMGASEEAFDISTDDVRRAIKSVSVLGNGFRLVDMAGHTFCISVPLELRKESVAVLELAGLLTPSERIRRFGKIAVEVSSSIAGWQKHIALLTNDKWVQGKQQEAPPNIESITLEDGEDDFVLVTPESSEASQTKSSGQTQQATASGPYSDSQKSVTASNGESLAEQLKLDSQGGWLTANDICMCLGWTQERAESVLNELLREGVCWVDDYPCVTSQGETVKPQPRYFFMSHWLQHRMPAPSSPTSASATEPSPSPSPSSQLPE